MADELRHIPLDQLVQPWVLLRPVNKELVEYIELRDSIELKGFLNSISVRESPRDPGKFEVIDGMYRWSVAKDLSLETIPAILKDNVSDEEVLVLQLAANAIRPETKPTDYARQLRKLQREFPQITLAELSVKISKSPDWIGKQLYLLKLRKPIQKRVDRGEICLQNAYTLSRLPPDLQDIYTDDAVVMPVREFKAAATGALHQFKEALRTGRTNVYNMTGLGPQAYLRTPREISRERRGRDKGPLILAETDCKTALDGWYMALDWVLHLDPASVEVQQQDLIERSRNIWAPDSNSNSTSKGKM